MKILLHCILFIFVSPLWAAPQNPTGDWLGFYEDTKIPGAKAHVSVDKNGVLSAYYVELYPKAGETIPTTCIDCPEPFKDKPLKNMPMLWDLKYKDGKWVDGKTFSLERKEIFDASAWLSEDGKTLYVRGSLGFISKTQELQRLTSGQ
jgi:uncharacterized protein (DUF2147 family)